MSQASSDGLLKWRQLCEIFKRIHFLRMKLRDVRMAWRMLFSRAKNDHVTLNLESKEWQNAFEILRSCDMKQLEYIQSLAGINRTHLSFHVGMSAALYFVTLPAIASFVISRWAAWSAAEDIYGFLLLNIGFGSLLVLKFYTNKWQAMELETCVAYIIAEKKLEAEPSQSPKP